MKLLPSEWFLLLLRITFLDSFLRYFAVFFFQITNECIINVVLNYLGSSNYFRCKQYPFPFVVDTREKVSGAEYLDLCIPISAEIDFSGHAGTQLRFFFRDSIRKGLSNA